MPKLTENQAKLFTDKNFGVVATLRYDGGPQTSVVWLDWDGENVVFNTTRPRAKGRNLDRDPRVSVTVFDMENPYRYVEVEGRAELDDAGANEHIHKLSHKYNGTDYPDPTGRVIVRVRPERVHASGVE
ncbi:MAG: PPOX class F420-dependent oxidoreductase [Actinobacteria bacterium]|nr:PPOX class F420-dependent oxidoreductase [Actinomycetota bacterium]MBV8396434.1 PPOX class F420-dependent oxidoreductase [Actinomycetota bacterium]MBV8597471.1 PPOX class F420-dependent oxidoreductase [Actinomycetota bacterium]